MGILRKHAITILASLAVLVTLLLFISPRIKARNDSDTLFRAIIEIEAKLPVISVECAKQKETGILGATSNQLSLLQYSLTPESEVLESIECMQSNALAVRDQACSLLHSDAKAARMLALRFTIDKMTRIKQLWRLQNVVILVLSADSSKDSVGAKFYLHDQEGRSVSGFFAAKADSMQSNQCVLAQEITALIFAGKQIEGDFGSEIRNQDELRRRVRVVPAK